MKINSLLLLLCVLLFACTKENPEQTVVKITGKLQNLDGTKVFLMQYFEEVDSAIVKDGKFNLSANVWNHQLCQVVFMGTRTARVKEMRVVWRQPIDIFVEHKADYELVANNKNALLYNACVLNTTSMDAQNHFSYEKEDTDRRIQLMKLSEDINNRLSKLPVTVDKLDQTLTDSLNLIKDQMADADPRLMRKYIDKNPNSYFSVYLLSTAPDLKTNTAYYVKIEKQLRQEYRDNIYGKRFIAKLRKYRSDLLTTLKFDAVDSLDKPFSFQKFKDSKLIILDFWATWSAESLTEMPAALKAEQLLKSKKVSYVFMTYDSRMKKWQSESAKLGLTHNYRLEKSGKNYLNSVLGMDTIPRYVIVNNKGEVVLRKAPKPSDAGFVHVVDSLLAGVI